MKTLISLLLCLVGVAAFGQAPPVLRTGFTTNTPNANQFSGNAFKNLGRITNGDFYGFLVQAGQTGSFFPGSTLAVAGILQLPFASTFAVVDAGGSVTNGVATDGVEYTAATKTLGVTKTPITVLAGTNSAVVTNIFLGATNAFTRVVATNNMTMTNLAGVAAGVFRNATVLIEPQAINRTNVYPVGSQYGQAWKTNVNAPLFTTLTGGVYYVLSLTTIDTNVLASMSVWQP